MRAPDALAASNAPPVFDEGASASRSVAENSAADTAIGSPVSATDADGHGIAYGLSGTDAASFSIDTDTGQLKTKAALDHETKSSYAVTVGANDGIVTTTIAITISVSDVNEAPSFPDGTSTAFSIAENTAAGTSIGDAVSASDPDGDTLTYSLTGDAAALFSIDSGTGQLQTKAALDHEASLNVFQVNVVASDGSLTATLSNIDIAVGDVDEAPSAPSAPTVSVASATSLSVSWSAPGNTGPDITDYDVQYRAKGVSSFTDASHSGTDTSATITGLTSSTTYEVQVRAKSDEGSGAWSASGEGTPVAPNSAPVFGEGSSASRSVAENSAADTAIGAPVSATDADGHGIAYSLNGTDKASFSIDTDTGQLKTKAALDHETKSSYAVTVGANDGIVTTTIAVAISVSDVNEAPAFPDGTSTSFSVNENTASGTSIGDAVSASDPDGDTLTYTLSGDDADKFAIVAGTGQLQTKSALDHEASPNVFQVNVVASDGTLTATLSRIDIAVGDVDEAPSAPTAPTVSVASATSLSVSWSTPENTGPDITGYDVQYRVKGGSTFTDASHSGTDTSVTITGLTSSTTYEVQVRATSDEGSGAWSASGEGTPAAPNAAPVFGEGSSASRSVDENSAKGTAIGSPVSATDADNDGIVYRLEGTDAASFDIDTDTGQLETKAALDHESKSSYAVAVGANDGTVTTTIAVAISVTDVNEAPAFPDGTSTSFSVNENTAAGTSIGDAVSASDPDGDTLTYTLSGDGADKFAIVAGTGQLQTKSALDHEASPNVFQVNVVASDGTLTATLSNIDIAVGDVDEAPSAPSAPTVAAASATSLSVSWSAPANTGPDITDYDVQYRVKGVSSFTDASHSGTDTSVTITGLTSSTTYEVQVRAKSDEGSGAWSASGEGTPVAPNSAPVFEEGSSASRSVDENSAKGTAIGSPVSATDADGDGIVYSLGGTDAASFSINKDTGQLQTSAALDHETKSSYAVAVGANDGTVTTTIAVAISVSDVNEAPFFPDGTSTSFSVNENTASGTSIGSPVTATDPDGDTLTYSLSGSDADKFAIVAATGQLQTKAALDHEASPNVFYVKVVASDGTLTATLSNIDIAVGDVDEAPSAPSAPTVSVASATSLSVSWSAPANTGPDITGYDVQYRVKGVSSFTDASHSGTDTSATVTGLTEGTTYELQVRATSDEGSGAWSASGEGTPAAPNAAPVFGEGSSASRSVDENSAKETAIGAAVSATDADGDGIVYSLGGTDAASFSIDESSGQLQTSAALDHESKSSYAVTVGANDGTVTATIAVTISVSDVNEAPAFPDGTSTSLSINENTAAGTSIGDAVSASDPDGDTLTYSLTGDNAALFSIDSARGQLQVKAALDHEAAPNVFYVKVVASDGSLTATTSRIDIAVGDVDEAPSAPSAPTVSVASATSLSVSWSAPANTGPDITDYDVQYRVKGVSSFTDASHSGTDTSVTITGLTSSTTYEVQVRATNDEGSGAWSASGEGTPVAPNSAPVFGEGSSASRSVAENVAAETTIGAAVSATDADGDGIVYRLEGTDAASFAIDEGTGQLKTKAALDHETKSSYAVTVGANDGTVTTTIAVTISVSDVNEAPSFPAGAPSLSVPENTSAGTGFGDAVAATDPDGDTLTYSLSGSDADKFAIVAARGQLQVKAALDHEADPNVFYVKVVASDGSLTATTSRIDIAVGDVDEAPSAPSAPTVSVASATSLSVSWSAPANTGPDITGYDVQYRVKGGSSFTDASHSGTSTSATITGLTEGTTYEVQVRATNDEGSGAWSASGEGTPVAPNSAPVFGEGSSASRSVDENSVKETAIGSPVSATDADGDGIVYSLGGTDAASFSINKDTGQLQTSAALDHETKSSYSVTVGANDGTVTTTIAITISVSDVNEAPSFPDGTSTAFSVNENTASGTSIGDAVSASDPDGDTLTYTLSGDGADKFAIVAGTGQLQTKSALDHEASPNVFRVNVVASDGTLTATLSGIDIAVGDVDEAPSAPSAPTVSVASATSLSVSWSAPANTGPDITDYDVQYREKGGSTFTDASHSGTDTSVTITGLTSSTTYEVQVRATNDEGSSAWSASGEGTPAAPNAAPLFGEGSSASRSVAENVAAETAIGAAVSATDADGDGIVYSLSGTDSASFSIDENSGQLQTSAALDHETKSSYAVTVGANDGTVTTTIAVAISVSDVNEAPFFPDGTSTSFSVNENTSAGTSIGDAVSASDPDGDTLTYSLAGDDAGKFAIVAATGQLQTKAALDHEASPNVFQVKVVASDGTLTATLSRIDIAVGDVDEAPSAPSAPTVASAGATSLSVSWSAPANTGPDISDYDVQYRVKGVSSFTDASHSGTDTSVTITGLTEGTTYEVQVRATSDEGFGAWSASGEGTPAAPNAAPVFGEGSSASRSVDENVAAETAIGSPVGATDADNDGIVYSLGGTDAASFAIDEGTGQLKTKAALDHESKSSYAVTVGANDGTVTTTIAVTISVSDVNEAPAFPDGTSTSFSINENTAAGTSIGDAVSASDPDGDTLTYSLAGDDAGKFAIVAATGQLQTKAALDHEASPNVFQVKVVASDGTLTATLSNIDIAVGDVDEAPSAPSAPTVSVASATSLSVSWSAPANTGPDITDYDVQYRVKGVSSFTDASHSGTDTSVTITGLTEGTTYEVQVRATSDEGSGAWSASGEGAPAELVGTPSAPAAPTVSAASETSLSVSWEAPATTGPAITDYDVRYKEEDAADFADASHDGAGTSATITGLTQGAAHVVQVRATNSVGDERVVRIRRGDARPAERGARVRRGRGGVAQRRRERRGGDGDRRRRQRDGRRRPLPHVLAAGRGCGVVRHRGEHGPDRGGCGVGLRGGVELCGYRPRGRRVRHDGHRRRDQRVGRERGAGVPRWRAVAERAGEHARRNRVRRRGCGVRPGGRHARVFPGGRRRRPVQHRRGDGAAADEGRARLRGRGERVRGRRRRVRRRADGDGCRVHRREQRRRAARRAGCAERRARRGERPHVARRGVDAARAQRIGHLRLRR